MSVLPWVALALSALPATLIGINLVLLRPPRASDRSSEDGISILIPARNEEGGILDAVNAALNSNHPRVEVVVLDDGSTDRTAQQVARVAAADRRVRLISGKPLPDGWCGKQFACRQLADAASHPWLLFQDADVRLAADAAPKLLAEAGTKRLDLISGFPRQRTATFGERLVVPLIHLVLLGYLPLIGMRFTRWSAFAAGCGQLFFVNRAAYGATGGHAAIRGSMHDGVKLPRAFREQGRSTGLVDATSVAECRMYRSFGDLFLGFAKNAHEGMGSAAAIVPWTVLLLGGHVLPLLLVIPTIGEPGLKIVLGALGLSFGARAALALRFRQPWSGVLLHPLGIAVIVAIQWYALIRRLAGRPVGWKGRMPV